MVVVDELSFGVGRQRVTILVAILTTNPVVSDQEEHGCGC
jgi:hypothetical protein